MAHRLSTVANMDRLVVLDPDGSSSRERTRSCSRQKRRLREAVAAPMSAIAINNLRAAGHTKIAAAPRDMSYEPSPARSTSSRSADQRRSKIKRQQQPWGEPRAGAARVKSPLEPLGRKYR
jgi:hypothetical protein